ncbi:MAG: T9SS type A sorting domain-containing protein [Ignavibacteria bacterium]|nr:T9SS type A sorting domain-containing protein [Ignavibacteria bacterium]
MFKKLFLLVCITLFGINLIYAQKTKSKIPRVPYKIVMNGDALVGTRVDGKPNSFGLPSLIDFVRKFKSEDKAYPQYPVTFVNTGCTTLYDICSNGSAVEIWQDPAEPDNIHAVFMTAPLNDGLSFPNRRSKYYFSSDRGTSWTYLADIPTGTRSGYPTISGLSDGTALVANHSLDGGGVLRCQAYKDAFPGVGSFIRLDAPGNNGYEWPRVMPTSSLSLTNKFVMIGSLKDQDTTRYNVCTNFYSTPSTWLGWNTIPAEQSEAYAIGRGSDGRIGIAYINDYNNAPNYYGDVWFIESTNNGTSFSTPLRIFDANFDTGGDSLGAFKGISISYKGNVPAVVFETVLQTPNAGYFPFAPSNIRFWSPSLPGSDPNRSIIIVDTSNVPFHPFVGVNDLMAPICRPSLGISSDGRVLFMAFCAASGNIGGSVDSTTFMDIWFSYSLNGGSTWSMPSKINPASPIKDWRYVSVSPVNDIGSNYYCNMVALKGSIPGSYINGSDNGQSMEEFWSIRVSEYFEPQVPNPPVLISPTNAATGVSLTPIFDWSDVSGATYYNFQMASDNNFTNIILNINNLSTSGYQAASALSPNTTYYWRAMAGMPGITSGWSNQWSFTTLGGPAAPTLLSPANGSNILTTTPTLDWNDVSGAVSYEVQIATDVNFVNLIVNIGTVNSQYITPSGTLAGNMTYYWRARAENSTGTGPWSSVWNFRVAALPTAPTLVSPPNYSSNQPPTILLDWDSLASASTYRLQIASDSLFISTVFDTSGVTRSYVRMRSGILLPNGKYYWRVNATNIAGTGPWSVMWNFRVNPSGIYQYSSETPNEFKLYNNYPNPFNPSTNIKFAIPKSASVKISVFDVSGKEIEALVNDKLQAGIYETRWNASKCSSGIYFYKIIAGDFSETKKMLLIK